MLDLWTLSLTDRYNSVCSFITKKSRLNTIKMFLKHNWTTIAKKIGNSS